MASRSLWSAAVSVVTHTTLHMLQSSKAQFVQEPSVQGENMTVLFEMTLHNLTDGDGIDEQDFLERVDILGAVGEDLAENYHIMVSNFAEYYRLAAYLLRYSKEPIGVAMGVPTLKELFEEKYYEELEGGILESFGRMFKNDLRLYVYPSLAEGGQVLNACNLQVASHLQSLYEYLLSNGFIRRIEDFREITSHFITRRLKQIRSGDLQWEQLVPESVAQLIRERGLLGYQSASDTKNPRKIIMAEEYSNQNAKKVLVADSDPAVLQAMKDQLQAIGFHATVVDTDTMATEHLRSEMFAAVWIMT